MPSISERLMPRFSTRTLTWLISVVQIILFIATLIVGGVKYGGAFVKGNSMLGPNGATFVAMGGKWEPAIRNGAVWRLFTAAMLHAGVIHIATNLFFQLRFGFTLEKRWGWKLFAVVYASTAIGASLFSCVMSPSSISVGASGALFGLLGADFAFLVVNWDEVADSRSEACMIVLILVINVIIGFGGQDIDNWAHFGGLLTGLFLGPVILPYVQQRERKSTIIAVSVLLLVGWTLLNLLIVFYDHNYAS